MAWPLHFLRRLFRTRRRNSTVSRKPKLYRPRIDILEDRYLLSVSVASLSLSGPPDASVHLETRFSDLGATYGTSYTGTTDWGDGTTSSEAVTAPSADGMFPGLGEALHQYTQAGTYTVVATIASSALGSDTGSAIVTIGGTGGPPSVAIASLSISEAADGSVHLETNFSDPGAPSGTSYTGTTNWGDGTTSTEVVTAPSAYGMFPGFGEDVHQYTQAGTYTIVATISSSTLGSGTGSTIVTITGSSGPSNHAPVVMGPGPQTYAEGAQVSLQVSAIDMDLGDILTYSAVSSGSAQGQKRGMVRASARSQDRGPGSALSHREGALGRA